MRTRPWWTPGSASTPGAKPTENEKDDAGGSTTGKSGMFTILNVAALVPTTRTSETWTASLPVFLTPTDSLALVVPRSPEKWSSSGVTSSGSRIFSTRGAGKAGSTFRSTLGSGFVAQAPRRRQAHRILLRKGRVRMVGPTD